MFYLSVKSLGTFLNRDIFSPPFCYPVRHVQFDCDRRGCRRHVCRDQRQICKPGSQGLLLEKSGVLLSKVRVSGGGRCNVTHACFDPAALICHYPRGGPELRGPFHRFQPRDTIEWFEARGVSSKPSLTAGIPRYRQLGDDYRLSPLGSEEPSRRNPHPSTDRPHRQDLRRLCRRPLSIEKTPPRHWQRPPRARVGSSARTHDSNTGPLPFYL